MNYASNIPMITGINPHRYNIEIAEATIQSLCHFWLLILIQILVNLNIRSLLKSAFFFSNILYVGRK